MVDTGENVDDVRTTQLEGTPLGKRMLAYMETVEDCTNDTGQCYQRNQANTAKAVGSIVTGVQDKLTPTIIAAASCSAGLPEGLTENDRIIRIQSCVIRRLAKQGADQQP